MFMYSRRLCVILMISILSYPARAQYERNEFHHYTPKDGLSNRNITGLVQDQSGYIWIATYRGLNRFDGNTFKQFLRDNKHNPLPDKTIFSSQLISENELAISTNDGAQVIDLKTLKAKNLEFATEDALRYWSYAIQYIQKDADGNYGVSTKTGFYIFSSSGQLKKKFEYYTAKDIGHSWMLFGRQIHLLPNGNMLQENSSGLLEYDRRKNTIGNLST